MIKKIEHFIGGALFTGTSGRDSMVFNPATGTESANVSLADANDVNTAVAAAKTAFPAWSETTPLNRARILFKFKELVEANQGKLAEMITLVK